MTTQVNQSAEQDVSSSEPHNAAQTSPSNKELSTRYLSSCQTYWMDNWKM